MLIIDIIKGIGGSISKARKEKQERDKRIDHTVETVELWEKQDDGRFAFMSWVREVQNEMSNLNGKVDGIMGTINTIFLIVDRTMGRKKNSSYTPNRRRK